jgi:UDP-3-O-[3-hydroxymyristoyl] glucosamine N-acyltransferase
VHPTAVVHPEARLRAPFYVGPRGQVAREAELGPDTVLVSDATVEPRARVRGSVVWSGSAIGEGAEVEGALIGPRVRVGRRAVVSPGAVLGEGTVVSEFSRTR